MNNREHDHEEWEDDIDDDEEEDGAQEEQSSGNGGAAKNAAQKAAKKKARQLAKKAMKALIKLGAKILGKLMAVLAPYALVIIAVLVAISLIFYISYDNAHETKGKEQEYQDEDTRHENKKKKNEDGEYIVSGMSAGNKVVKSFYSFYTQQSYYKVIDKKMYKSDSKKVEEVKDKYNREKEFMLSPDFLWSLDEHLNQDKFRYPEQFIQVVYHDPKTFELKQLTNKDDLVTAKSQEYDEKTKLKKEGKKVTGVWDYGFAPILQYKEFEEKKERRGAITEMQVWSKSKQKFETQKVKNGKSSIEQVEGFPKTVYMIDKVTSSIGTISNTITHEWENTGESWTKTISEEVSVPVRYYETVKVPVLNEIGLPLYYVVDTKGKKTSERTTVATKFPVTSSVKVKKYKNVKKKATRKIDGYVWSKEPRYDGEPDTSKIVGSKYLEDYMLNYTAYVPENAMGEFNLKDRTGKDIKGLEGILKDVDEDLGAKSDYDNAGGSTSDTSVDAFTGVTGGSANFKKAMQYAEYYQKYGNMYGVDPLLLASKGAQERSGVHGTTVDGGGAIGISQIQVNSHINSTKKAFNYKTGKWETELVTMSKLADLEMNIKIGAMIFQNEMKEQDYNPLIGLQGYNYGQGAILDVISKYASSKGISVADVRKDVKNTEWLAWREKVRPGYGDGQYIEHVLGHYPGGGENKPWILDAKGNKVYFDGKIKTGEGIAQEGSSSDSDGFSFSDFLASLKEKWSELFPDVPKEFSKKHERFVNKQIGDNPIMVLNMSFAMTEKKYFSEYGYITPKQWKEKYKLLFSTPPSVSQGDNSGISDELNKHFPNGYGAVVEKAEKIAVPYNGKGISIQAPEGSKVLALADGEVKEVGRDFVVIDHGNGATTRYSTLKSVKVKEGDKVKMGATVGISGKNVFFELTLDGQPSDPSWVVGGGSITGAFITPAKGRLSSPFGNRPNPTGYGIEFHTGVDIAAPVGTPIHAAADGEVIRAEMTTGGFGNMVHIKHMVNGKPMSTVYAHLNTIGVQKGQKVVKGQVIAEMGSTGRSTGPHLHFEVQNGLGTYMAAPLDPAKYVKL